MVSQSPLPLLTSQGLTHDEVLKAWSDGLHPAGLRARKPLHSLTRLRRCTSTAPQGSPTRTISLSHSAGSAVLSGYDKGRGHLRRGAVKQERLRYAAPGCAPPQVDGLISANHHLGNERRLRLPLANVRECLGCGGLQIECRACE